uniref:E3 ubiquitin-protein ligase n=1 Tax=Xiphophorus couchianus TaxID=32473 RepID=A0A3B5KYQ5_9TELE
MFDKDLAMLQVGASMMDPNHFLMIVLSRFELFHTFSADLAQQNTLIEEMLHLVIMVVGERYVPGVGQVEPLDEVRREILHQLCIRPMAHSELVKSLPENGNKETGLERVIDSIASFRKPGVTGRGLYELRPEWSRHFDLYFHHYSRADQSKVTGSEPVGLRRVVTGSLPPPRPPPLCPPFASLVNLLQSDVLLALEGAVLQWAGEPSGGGWTESMLQRVLHLVAMALLEEQQQLESSGGDEDVSFTFSSEAPSTSGSVLALLENLQSAPHLEVHKDMITWILKMVGNIKTTRERTYGSSVSVSHGRRPEEDKAERKRKAEMARLRREKVMAQMSEMQKHFINENKELFQQSMEELEAAAATAEHRRVGGAERRQLVTCILCQEEQEVRGHGRAMVLAAFIQRSTVLSKNRKRLDPLFVHPDLSVGVHTASCGHIMHATCWQRYFEAVQQKEQRRQQRLRGHTSYDVENGEFLCPLCECLSNTVIPLLPHALSPNAWGAGLSGTADDVSSDVTSSLRNPFSSGVGEMINTFSMSAYKVGLKVNPNEQDPRVPVLSWSTCAYTMQSIERLLMDEKKPLFGSLPCRQNDCLSSLTRFSSACWTAAPIRTPLTLAPDVSSCVSLCRCPRSGGDKSRAPTLCLVCGCMLCSQSYCCQTEVEGEDVGACTAHTFTCGAGIGLFLRVRESQVLFVAGKTKGCFYPPPYLDDYGETDPGLKRGNPLHLCSERYQKIERLWRQHGIAEVIGHAQEANQTLVAIDWQHL